MAEALKNSVAVVGIDIGKNSFHVVGLDKSGVIVLRQKWSRGQVEARFANMPPCLIGMEACVGAHQFAPASDPRTANGMVRPCSCPASDKLARGTKTRRTPWLRQHRVRLP